MDETCQQCGKTISRRAKANIWQGEKVVCTPCLRQLESDVEWRKNLLLMVGRVGLPWMVKDGGKQHGPYTTAQLKELLRHEKIDWMAGIRREGMKEWKPAARLFTMPDLSDGRLELRDLGQGPEPL